MFGRKRDEPKSLLTPDLMQLIAISSVELEAKNAAAIERWELGSQERWSADLAVGTLSFHFADHTLTGPVSFLGSYAESSSTFLWGWANESIPDHIKAASEQTRAVGETRGMNALTSPKLEGLDASLANDLAAVSVELNNLAGLYRAPTANGYAFLGFTEFSRS